MALLRWPARRRVPGRDRYLRASVALAAVLCMLPALLVVRRAISTEHAPRFLTASVVRIDLESAVQASGILEAQRQVDVGAQVSGQLKRLHVRLGDVVAAGASLADIDPILSRSALRIAESNLQSLEAQRRANAAGLTQARLALHRQQEMLAQDATSRQEVEAAQAQLQVVEANIASFDAQIRQARAQVESAEASLAYTHISAPIAGEVVSVMAQEGQTLLAAQQAPVILRLADRSAMTVKAQVSEADVIRVRPGLPAWFNVLGHEGERFSGVVRAVEPVPGDYLAGGKPGPVFYNAVFDVPNPEGRLRIGMTAQVAIVMARVPAALTIPMTALGPADAQGRYAVRVLRRGQPPATLHVRLGIRDSVRVQVLEGLSEGEEVVTDDAGPGSGGSQQPGSSG